jgi:hypothetical protein
MARFSLAVGKRIIRLIGGREETKLKALDRIFLETRLENAKSYGSGVLRGLY